MPKAGKEFVELFLSVSIEGVGVVGQRATIPLPPLAGITDQVVVGLVKTGVTKLLPVLAVRDVEALKVRLRECRRSLEEEESGGED